MNDATFISIDPPRLLAQHDIVYRSPATDGYDGFPLGNGDLCAMAWNVNSRLKFQINKTNTWDDGPDGPFEGWDANEQFTVLRGCAQLQIDPVLPLFDWMYLDDFEARLKLAEATASWRAESPLGTLQASALILDDPSAMFIHYEDHLSEAVSRQISLGRWGSRTFPHWYARIRRDSILGDGGTVVHANGNEITLVHNTRSLQFAVAMRVVGENLRPAQTCHSRQAMILTEKSTATAFDLAISVVTSEEHHDALGEARRRAAAATNNLPALRQQHRERWNRFWAKSFISIPDKYLENLWYMNLYQFGSSGLGEYPPPFAGGVWSWNRDVRPWAHYYQWNQQQYTWPIHAAGHPELMRCYCKWKLQGLSRAINAASQAHHCDGAFYSDVSDRRGNQGILDHNVAANITPSGFTAIDLWRHYEFTLDLQYLREVMPLLQEVARFYVAILQKDSDGKYHVPAALPMEAPLSQLSRDTTNDLAVIAASFDAFLQAYALVGDSDAELAACVTERRTHLAGYVMTRIPPGIHIANGPKSGDPIIAFGMRLHDNKPGDPWLERHSQLLDSPMDVPSSFHAVHSQLIPLFPADLVGMDDRGSVLFTGIRNATLAFRPTANFGHTIIPICLARLGEGERLKDVLDAWVDEYQLFSQGLFSYFKRSYAVLFAKNQWDEPHGSSDHLMRGLTNRVAVIGSSPPESVNVLREPFQHYGMEGGAIFQTTINEMLLQSHQGCIRVFPAVPADWNAAFTLHARGAFVITSERSAGEVLYIGVESLKGGYCTIANPWAADERVRVRNLHDGKIEPAATETPRLRFQTIAGGKYVVERATQPVSNFPRSLLHGPRNQDVKRKRSAQLGIERRF